MITKFSVVITTILCHILCKGWRLYLEFCGQICYHKIWIGRCWRGNHIAPHYPMQISWKMYSVLLTRALAAMNIYPHCPIHMFIVMVSDVPYAKLCMLAILKITVHAFHMAAGWDVPQHSPVECPIKKYLEWHSIRVHERRDQHSVRVRNIFGPAQCACFFFGHSARLPARSSKNFHISRSSMSCWNCFYKMQFVRTR